MYDGRNIVCTPVLSSIAEPLIGLWWCTILSWIMLSRGMLPWWWICFNLYMHVHKGSGCSGSAYNYPAPMNVNEIIVVGLSV